MIYELKLSIIGKTDKFLKGNLINVQKFGMFIIDEIDIIISGIILNGMIAMYIIAGTKLAKINLIQPMDFCKFFHLLSIF